MKQRQRDPSMIICYERLINSIMSMKVQLETSIKFVS